MDEDVNALSSECDLQITRLAELSAQDFHLDHDLYLKCKGDRENFCAEVSVVYPFNFTNDLVGLNLGAFTDMPQATIFYRAVFVFTV